MKHRSSLLLFVLLAGITLLSYGIWRQRQLNRLDKALMVAVQNGDPKEVTLLLRQGANPDLREPVPPPHGWRDTLRRRLHPASIPRTDTVLMIASKQDYLTTVQSLLDAGAQMNADNDKGETALTIALEEIYPDIMFELLARGANPNRMTKDILGGQVPLIMQTLRTEGRLEKPLCVKVIQSLLDHGADVNAADSDGETALIQAVKVDETEIARLLIQHGADVNRPQHDHKTPLHASAYDPDAQDLLLRESSASMILLLRSGASVQPADNAGWNALCWSAQADEVAVARAVISRGLGVDSRDRRGRTPLMYAAAYGTTQAFNLLLAQGADVNARDDNGWTALMFAAQFDQPLFVDRLLSRGADPRLRDKQNHWTAEQRAVHLGQARIAELLRRRPGSRKAYPKPKQRLFGYWHDAPDSQKRVKVDADHWIETVQVSRGGQPSSQDMYGVAVVDAAGKRGRLFGADEFYGRPEVQVFHDTDGHPYAFLKEADNCIVAIRGRTLVQVHTCEGDYGGTCQVLPAGGALVFDFYRGLNVSDLPKDIPVAYKYDQLAEVYRFHAGKLGKLGLAVVPQQESR